MVDCVGGGSHCFRKEGGGRRHQSQSFPIGIRQARFGWDCGGRGWKPPVPAHQVGSGRGILSVCIQGGLLMEKGNLGETLRGGKPTHFRGQRRNYSAPLVVGVGEGGHVGGAKSIIFRYPGGTPPPIGGNVWGEKSNHSGSFSVGGRWTVSLHKCSPTYANLYYSGRQQKCNQREQEGPEENSRTKIRVIGTGREGGTHRVICTRKGGDGCGGRGGGGGHGLSAEKEAFSDAMGFSKKGGLLGIFGGRWVAIE